MIQRIQTIFFFLAAACGLGTILLPLANSKAIAEPFLADKLYTVQDHSLLLVFAALAIIIPLAAIFLFKNRSLQTKIGYAGILMAILFIAAAVGLIMTAGYQDINSLGITQSTGIFFPLGTVLFSILGIRSVNKDEKLVKSMDRLR